MEVPVYGDARVSEAALPNVRLNTDAPIEAFGGGAPAANVTRATQGLNAEAGKIIANERDKAVDTMTQEGYAKIVAEKNRLLHDPKSGALLTQGRDSFSTPDTAGKAFDDYAGKVEKDMAEPEARRMFAAMRSKERGELDNTLSQHVARQTEVLQDETFHGLIATETDDAILNMGEKGKITDNLRMMRMAAAEYADRKGLKGPDAAPARAALWKGITDKLHVGVINRLVAQENYEAARGYFAANEGGISSLNLAGLEQQIKKTDVLAQKDSYLAAGKQLDKSKGSSPAETAPGFERLSSEQRQALERRFEDKQSPTAHHEFYALTQAQVADLDRAEFEVKYWSRFDAEHRRKADAYWQAATDAQSGGAKGEAFKSIRGDHDMIVNALRRSKVVPSSGDLKGDDFEKAQRFEDHVDEKFKAFAHDNKRNPKDEEKQAIIHKAMLDTVYTDNWGYDTAKVRGVLSEDDIKEAYVPITAIHQVDRAKLINLARANGAVGIGINDGRAAVVLKDRIERAYAAASGGASRAQIISIMKGQ